YFAMMQAESTTSLPARVMLASRYYFENYLWPTRLSAWSPPPQSIPVLSAPVAIGAGEWLVLSAVMAISRRRCRPGFVGIGLFALLLAPFLAAMTARTFLTADRYMYLPIIGLHLAVAAWAVRTFDAMRNRISFFGGGLGVLVVSVLLAMWTAAGWDVA